MFFSAEGRPLQPRFTRPNRRGVLVIVSGDYVLEPLVESSAPGLREILGRVTYVEGCGLNSAKMVEAQISEAERASGGDTPRSTEPRKAT